VRHFLVEAHEPAALDEDRLDDVQHLEAAGDV
jgi:hypothetical protein